MKMIIKLNPMKALFLLLLFGLTSCYVYKPYTGIEVDTNNKSSSMRSTKGISLSDREIPTSRHKGPEGPGKSVVTGDLKIEDQTDNPDLAAKNREIEEQKLKEMEAAEKRAEANGKIVGKPGNDQNLVPSKNQSHPKGESELKELSLKEKIKANKYYKISVAEKQYKIQADQWEGDTLVSHILRQPKKVLRFHENQIDEEELLERRFSKSYSDIFTVGSYVGVGAAILLFLL